MLLCSSQILIRLASDRLQDLVNHFQQHSLNRHFPGMETTLAIPFRDAISRGTSNSAGSNSCVGSERGEHSGVCEDAVRIAHFTFSFHQENYGNRAGAIAVCLHSQKPRRAEFRGAVLCLALPAPLFCSHASRFFDLLRPCPK